MSGCFQGCVGIASGERNGAETGGRLGKRDLGRYAFEDQMPDWLHRLLEDEEKQRLEDAPSRIICLLSKLLEQDPDVESAYFCHSAVCYIGKIKSKGKDEGNHFCGYHNIQMLASYVIATGRQSLEEFMEGIPTICKIQNIIEEAWDQGFNEFGRVQTGGIKGTRKHIGTPEAQALFSSLKVPCKADRLEDIKGGAAAYTQLLDFVDNYFSNAVTNSHQESTPRVRSTGLPPIYLQRPRHSMTIVGIEKRKGGFRSLLVFDPAYNPSKDVMRLVNLDRIIKGLEPSMSLTKPYRRGKKYLRRYHAFETLRLAVPT